jgi:hypothetical protein
VAIALSNLSEVPIMNTPTQATPQNRQNSGDTPLKTTTGKASIAFDYAEGGTIALHGNTGISSLLRLGAMVKTRQYQPELSGSATATDEKGREIVIRQLDGAAEMIVDSLGTVGKLLALTSEELNPGDVSSIGWLVCGLAELAEDVLFELSEVSYERERDQGARDGT